MGGTIKTYFFYTTSDWNIMKRQLLILGILINVIFYSCSAVSTRRHIFCYNGLDIHGSYKLSAWKTVELKTHYRNRLDPTNGWVNVRHSKSVTCTGDWDFENIKTKSCTNWSLLRKTIRYKVVCFRKPKRPPPIKPKWPF